MGITQELWVAYRMRWKRRRLLYRALRKRHQLSVIADRTHQISNADILVASTVRNEAVRLPFFLDYYRGLGVGHFMFVDNSSDDGTREYLEQQGDVSLWATDHAYRLSRFGVDWLTWLQFKYAHGHWCLTLDADEILIYPYCDTRSLQALTAWLDQTSTRSFGALMLDMYPKGPLNQARYEGGQDPTKTIPWFDAGNYSIKRHPELKSLWIQGGVRARRFFAEAPRRAPTLSKIPLVKWNRRYAYVNSTHSLLPPALNRIYNQAGGENLSGVLLHAKFLHTIVEKSEEEMHRKQHFANSALYQDYHESIVDNPDLWCNQSTKYEDWRQLEALGLLSKGEWP